MNIFRFTLSTLRDQLLKSPPNSHWLQRLGLMQSLYQNSFKQLGSIREVSSLRRLHKRGDPYRPKKNKNPLGYNVPFLKGVVLKTLIKKPKKPNSANRKCVLLRLSNGKEMTAHVPGEGHNLQEHNIVLVRPGRTKDVPGLKLKCVRGKYDLPHVVKEKS